METTQQQSVIQELLKFMKHTGISQNKISSMLSFSTATLISLIDGSYTSKDPKKKEKYLAEIQDLLNKEKERFEDEIGRAVIPFQNIHNYRIFKEVCSICEKYMEIGVVVGEPGMGKTRSASKYFYDHTSTIYLSVRPSYSTKTLIKRLYEKLGGTETTSLDDMVEFIVGKLKGSKRLMIFDQLEYGSDKAIDILRTIYDECLDESGNGTIGMVFTGLPQLIYKLKQFPQLHQRINWYRKLGVLNSADEVTKGMNDEEVGLFVHSVFPKANGEIKLFAELTDGNPRVLKKLLDRTLRLCELNKCSLKKDVIHEAMNTIRMV